MNFTQKSTKVVVYLNKICLQQIKWARIAGELVIQQLLDLHSYDLKH